jgi:hypothetical protein
LSRSEPGRPLTFEGWIAEEFARGGPFTALVVLVAIGELSVTPLRSSFLHVIGTELDWSEIARLLDAGGPDWDAALFAPRTDAAGGPLSAASARIAERDLADAILADRKRINAEHFFDRSGRRLEVEEVTRQ